MKKNDFIFLLLIILMIFIVILFKFFYKCFIVETGSMHPTLKIGDLIIVKHYNQYKIGDIITFKEKNNNNYITHRIVQINNNKNFITKGDFNNVIDKNCITQEEIVGKVIFHSQILGLIFFKYKVFTVTILVIILIIANLVSIRR